MTRDQIAALLFAVDEKAGPIRLNVPYSSLKSFQRSQYERYADAIIAAMRDSDGSPKGGDAKQGSVEDDSAGRNAASPEPSRPSPHNPSNRGEE